MDEIEKNIRRKLRDDFTHYSSKCLKIRSKSGEIQPFILNQAQRHIHERVEQQRRETNRVRAIVLKGRQQGCCFSPEMKVLTSDYKWKELDEISVGDKLIACDEISSGKTKINRNHSRKFRTATVEAKKEFYKQTYEVLFDNGARLNVTPDHRMLCKKRGGDNQEWRYVADFKIGDYIRVVARPPNYQANTYEDGWMAGIIDGEGSARTGKGAKRISIHQVPGKVLDRMKAYFEDIEMPYKEVIDAREDGINKKGRKPVHRLDIHRLPYIIELFARCQPTRFTQDEWYVGHELPGKAAQDGIKPWAKVISIKPLERQRVIDLQTSAKTFICEGLVSHNSTYIEGRYYWLVTHRFGARAFILTHDNDATNNLFEMAQRYHEHCPSSVRPTIDASNAKELIFAGLDSGYKLGTAGNKSVGRSSTIQLLHGSEVAYWPNASEHAKGILQAVPNEHQTEVFIESTANGIGNYFHEQWQLAESGQSDFIPIFVPWFWQKEYRREIEDNFKLTEEEDELANLYGLSNEQLSWRRSKITELSAGGLDGVKSFMQEYPCTPIEAFIMSGEDSFITPDIVERARKVKTEKIGKLIIGCDPATSGNDRTAIIRRQTRCAYGLQTFCKKSATEITNILHRIIMDENPDVLVLDGSPAGGGAEIRDRLWQLGHKERVISVLSSETPYNQQKYFNKRAEMWGEAKQALLDYPFQLPDSDELAADLCGVRLRNDDIHQRIKLEKKEDMRKRGIRSPDCGDAFALTFAKPDKAILAGHSSYDMIAKDMANSFNNIDRLKKKAYG